MTTQTLPSDYFRLVEELPLRQIRTGAQYDAAANMLDRLAVRDDLSKGEREYLDVLAVLVQAYDDEHYPVKADRRTPLQRVKSLLRSAGMTPSQFGDVIGSRPAASMFLNGTRKELSKPQIRRLARHFRMDAGYFF